MKYHDFIYWKPASTNEVYTIIKPKIFEISIDKIGKTGFVFFPFNKENKGILFEGKIERTEKINVSNFEKNISFTDHDISKKEYVELVKKAVKAIKNGNFDKVVHARCKTITLPNNFSLENLFISLCKNYKNSLVYCLKAYDDLWIGATPELLLKNDNSKMKTFALAGTKKNTENYEFGDKETNEQKLVKDYIVEVLKNNGSENIEIENSKNLKNGNLTHIINEINFSSNKPYQLLIQLHPTPAVCGMPYKKSFDFIKNYEQLNRSFYSGFLGKIDSMNNFDFWVNLRCAKVLKNQIRLFAGAGITAQSNPDKEWSETENKMKIIADFL
ncbi:MAG: chorismate-binding protein [Bacteroidetes bacterium]|nr:chorismate-binding protein [Bacteroidota bacterium]